jgi:HD superfamily phosphohydrolase
MSIIVNDCIHRLIVLPKMFKDFIDIPEFQRLRHLKQLGLTDYVFPSAVHTRFSHSLGVAHLARRAIQTIRINQPDCGLDDEDELVYTLAGLYHDIGHGPFSHEFEHMFPCFNHEENSEKIIKSIFKNYVFNLKNPSHICTRVCNAINGRAGELKLISGHIFDVDRLDYLQRDAYHTNLQCSPDTTYILQNLRIIDKKLCISEKCKSTLVKLLEDRHYLHMSLYQHKTVAAINLMVKDIFHHEDIKAKLLEHIKSDKFIIDDRILFMLAGPHGHNLDIYNDIINRNIYKQSEDGDKHWEYHGRNKSLTVVPFYDKYMKLVHISHKESDKLFNKSIDLHRIYK